MQQVELQIALLKKKFYGHNNRRRTSGDAKGK